MFVSGRFVQRHTHPDGVEMYICCVDTDDTILLADHGGDNLYLLQMVGEESQRVSRWTQLNTDTTIRKPHDATLCNGRVYVISSEPTEDGHSSLFMLDVD